MSKTFLIIDSSESNSDLYYKTNFFVPDPVVFIENEGETILVLNRLEFDRGVKQASVDKVLSYESYMKKVSEKNKKKAGIIDIVDQIFREKKIKNLVVERKFPILFADELRKRRYKVSVSKNSMLFPKRLKKSESEVSHIKSAVRQTTKAMDLAIKTIKTSKVKNNKLYSRGKLLTSEGIKKVINSYLAGEGYSASHTIVACGLHSSMPHHSGEGPLRAGKPIVIDIFPKSQKNGYFGDMTRTVIKGKPSEELAKMYKTVLEGQKLGISLIKHGVKSSYVHQTILDLFERNGFKTGMLDGKPQGFIHSTGHGLGLDIHEPPRIGLGNEVLEEGNVVTVEPGLYYEKLGGIRIEDVVQVTKKGCTNLTRYNKRFIV